MYYFGWTAMNTLTMLHFEISVIQSLKRAGYHVIYKAHPDSIKESSLILPKYADEYLTEDFSQAYIKADCILYTYPGTTTFGFSLMTNVPIVVFCENIDKWHPSLFEKLKRRCVILPISVDEATRVIYDERDLLNAVDQSPDHLDHTVVHEFALK
jgi:hypothetical protein